MKTIRLKIDGMHCGGCVRRVDGVLRSVPGVGVDEVAVGAATLRLESDAAADAVTKALADQGYPARAEATDERG